MKKKSHRDIPDFSRQSKRRPEEDATQIAKGGASRTPQAPPRPTVKPHSTSAKSGRRGQ